MPRSSPEATDGRLPIPFPDRSLAFFRYLFPALILLLGILLPSRAPAQIFSTEVKRVSENFICQCSCNHQLSGCGAPLRFRQPAQKRDR
jgi:hypothetical protein